MFSIVGLTIFDWIRRGSPICPQSAGMNINLIWGVVMLVFGTAMFLLGRRADKLPRDPPPTDNRVWPVGHGH
jgi:hypothetical protein